MAIGEKTGGKDFQKGHMTPGPGRPKLDAEAKALRSLNQFEFHKILNDLGFKTKDELQAKINDSTTTALELAIASILAKAISSGDPTRLSYITDRLVGKPKESLEIQIRPYQELDDEELARRIETIKGRISLPPGTSTLLP